jgi:hypothetical protein
MVANVRRWTPRLVAAPVVFRLLGPFYWEISRGRDTLGWIAGDPDVGRGYTAFPAKGGTSFGRFTALGEAEQWLKEEAQHGR